LDDPACQLPAQDCKTKRGRDIEANSCVPCSLAKGANSKTCYHGKRECQHVPGKSILLGGAVKNQGTVDRPLFGEALNRAEVAYVKTKEGYEVDFLSRNADGSQWLVQVSASVDNQDTLARELRALKSASKEHHADRQLLLTAESRMPFPETPPIIEIQPAWQWMLGNQA
jgi:hypothetical protein